jgi:hypothetical protein
MPTRGFLIIALTVSPAFADGPSALSNEPLDTINPHREFQYNDPPQPKTEWLIPGMREQQSNGEGCTITGWGRACGPTNGF